MFSFPFFSLRYVDFYPTSFSFCFVAVVVLFFILFAYVQWGSLFLSFFSLPLLVVAIGIV